MSNEQLDFAFSDYEKYGIDPDETMILTDKEFEQMNGTTKRESKLNDELAAFSKEAAILLADIREIREESIPEMEELVESESMGEALCEYRSELASYKSSLQRKLERLDIVRKEIDRIQKELSSFSVTESETINGSSSDPVGKPQSDEIDGQISIFDLLSDEQNIRNQIEALNTRIDYIINHELIETEALRDQALDYTSRFEYQQDINALNYELGIRRNEIAKLEEKLKELGFGR